jgi:hypothetical protein
VRRPRLAAGDETCGGETEHLRLKSSGAELSGKITRLPRLSFGFGQLPAIEQQCALNQLDDEFTAGIAHMMRQKKSALQMLSGSIEFAAVDLRDREHGQIGELNAWQLMTLCLIDTSHEMVACCADAPALIPRIAESTVCACHVVE